VYVERERGCAQRSISLVQWLGGERGGEVERRGFPFLYLGFRVG
jgi:hypothetical protein